MESICNGLEKCKKHIVALTIDIKNLSVSVMWFKDLCKLIADVIIKITTHTQNTKQKLDKNSIKTLLLYLTQVITLLSLLIQLFLKENELKEVITEAREFTIKQLTYCLDGILSQIQNGATLTENEPYEKLIDIALNKLAEIDIMSDRETCLNAYYLSRKHIEEVLCNSMSIAQVTYEDDSKIIRGSCKAVLCDLDSLLAEINKYKLNIAMCNLSVDSCYDKLCALERKVNACVLRLSLKIFSHYSVPLDKLYDCCFTKLVSSEALDNVIMEFDFHVDRIMQIALFAISSTSNISSVIKMKNCLASLEALESELVPNLNAVFISNTDHSKHFAMLLVKHWKHQAEILKNSIYMIIDPFTFCQVAYEEIKAHIHKIQDLFTKEACLPLSTLADIIEESFVLVSVVTCSLQGVDLDNSDIVEKTCQDIRDVSYELKCAIDLLLVRNKPTNNGNQRIMKRCKILKGLVKKLLLTLAEDDVTINDMDNGVLCNSKNENAKELTTNEMIDKTLDHISLRSKEMVKERSVLYKAPKTEKKITNNSIKLTKPKSVQKSMPLSKLVHLRNMQFSLLSKTNNESSLDLQITEILADLENLSTSIKP